jgi:SanA protein
MGISLVSAHPRGAAKALKRHPLRALLVAVALLFALLVLGGSLCQWVIFAKATGRHHSILSALPHTKVALVLGTGKYVARGRPNLYYTQRITAAANLYKAGKVEYLLVSGDNRKLNYNEPATMRRDLVAAGVPKDKIVCDYAGFRTLDSVVRAKKVFGQDKLIIVSQRFHNERALFLAQASGIEAVGYDADEDSSTQSAKVALRENLARVQAVLDVWVLHTRPKFLGEKVEIQ